MKTKICKYKNHVGDRKLLITEFRKAKKNKDGYASQCKTCANAINKRTIEKDPNAATIRKAKRRKKMLKKYRDWKSAQGCKCCTENIAVCLELHHLDPSDKEITPADMNRRGWGWVAIMKEAAKCVVLCSNCHKKVHADLIDLSNYK